uniref:Ecdysoneless n=1 Tax=Eptatretus burgeri TaxID=7764 RepID=A0A8C4NAH9_EPTBU
MASHALNKKVIPEDSVCYKLFLQPSLPAKKLSRNVLECYRDEILGFLAPCLVGYIWQNERFRLHYGPPKGEVPAHLAGVTDFGDNIEDEWFIVFLLREVTRRFPELFAWMEDVDGQFLLIESANHLPRWLNPDSCDNRVFLRRGEVHIIPPSRAPGDTHPEPAPLKLQSALDILAQNGDKYLAGERVRQAIGIRVDCYPVKAQDNLHHAYCILPAVLASLLQRHPQLVAPAVQAFYLRDPVDLRACRTFSAFSPEPSVLTMVHRTYRVKKIEITHSDTWRNRMNRMHENEHFTPARDVMQLHVFLVPPWTPPSGRDTGGGDLDQTSLQCFIKILLDYWLNISPEGLDRLLQEAAGTSEAQAESEVPCKAQPVDYNLSEMVKGVKAFVKKVSSHDGAEMPCDDLEEEQDEYDLEVEDEYCETGESNEDEDDAEAGARSEDVDTAHSLRSLMYEMDVQLQGTTMGQSFSRKQNSSSSDEEDMEMKKEEDGENEQLTPIDIDLNLVQNLLASLGSQDGLAGPAANILHGMGITLPPATDT